MKGKIIEEILFIVVITLLSSYFIIRQNIYNDTFINILDQTEENINSENWIDASENSNQIKEEWNRIKHITMLNFGESDISDIEEHINSLISGTKNQDKITSLSSTLFLKDSWNNINKLVPQP